MPTSFTLGVGPFPVGTTVGVYARPTVMGPAGPVGGAVLASAVTGTDSSTTFTGLQYETNYWAAALVGAGWRSVAFRTEDDPGRALVTVADIAVLREAPVNVRDAEYGAACDDVTDDLGAIQAAEAVVRAAGGGELLIPNRARFGSQLVLGTRVVLVGTGERSGLRFTGSSNTDAIVNADVIAGNPGCGVKNMTVLGPEDGTVLTTPGANTGRGIYFRFCDDAVIEGCVVSRFYLQGVHVAFAARSKIRGNTVKEIKGGNGISVDEDATDTIITANTVRDVADCGIGTHNGSLRTVITANAVTNTAYGRGIDIFGAPETVAQGNVLKDIGGSGAAAHGIWVAPGLSGQIPHRCQIVGNEIYAAQDGIQVWGDNATAINDTLIASNMIYAPGTVGVHMGRKVVRSSVIGNHVQGAGGHGIHFEEGGGLVPLTALVSANNVRGCVGTGLIATTNVTGLTGAGNSLLGNGAIVSVPAGNTVLYEALAGFLQVNGGLTVTELYATAGLYPSGVFRHTGASAGFYGATAIAKRGATADATDLASVIALANALKADLQAYGLKT